MLYNQKNSSKINITSRLLIRVCKLLTGPVFFRVSQSSCKKSKCWNRHVNVSPVCVKLKKSVCPQRMYRSDLNYLRGAAWIATGALQIEESKRATDLISDVRCLLWFLSIFFLSLLSQCCGKLSIFPLFYILFFISSNRIKYQISPSTLLLLCIQEASFSKIIWDANHHH